MVNTIKCPNCFHEFPLEEAVSEEYRKELREKMLTYKKEKEEELLNKEREWKEIMAKKEKETSLQLQKEKDKFMWMEK